MKKLFKIIGIFMSIFLLFIVISIINNNIQFTRKDKLFKPIGKMVKVDGHKMSVYSEGIGDKTLVFMSGGGTSSPILDFKTLYSKLKNKYKIVVVEKDGYGFSDVYDEHRDIDTVLSETRKALKLSGENGPYILFPHSLSGLEAIYWAQKYPSEVQAIVGLDPSVPEAYKHYNMPNDFITGIAAFSARIGIIRFIPSICDSSAAIRYGSLTSREKKVYRAVFYRRTSTEPMLEELKKVKENAAKVQRGGIPKVPLLFFISNGDGTGFNRAGWVNSLNKFIDNAPSGKKVSLNCGHYVHDYKADEIASKAENFLNNLSVSK